MAKKFKNEVESDLLTAKKLEKVKIVHSYQPFLFVFPLRLFTGLFINMAQWVAETDSGVIVTSLLHIKAKNDEGICNPAASRKSVKILK